jgi:hypothetical protein
MSKTMVNINEMHDQITTATLNVVLLKAFLKVIMPIARMAIPKIFTGKSQKPLDRFKQTFHRASQIDEINK